MLRYTILIIIFINFIFAKPIDVFSKRDISLLENSYIFIGEDNVSFDKIDKYSKAFRDNHINIGMSSRYIWIKFHLYNSGNRAIQKAIVLSSPLLEEVFLFSKYTGLIDKTGMMYINSKHQTLPYIFSIIIPPKTHEYYYIKTHTIYTPINFSIHLKHMEKMLIEDKNTQAVNLILIGMILSLMIYTILMSIYLKDKSYFLYGVYLFALIYQQITYLGLTQIYFPSEFIIFEAKFTIYKIIFLILSSAFFTMSFLETKKLPIINNIYKVAIIITILEGLFLNTQKGYSLFIVILTGTFFIIFNFISGVIAYLNGKKEARLFILGFGVVSISYLMLIVDALGIASVMIYFHNILIWTTVIEALVLSLAFADRYIILQQEKSFIDQKLLQEYKERENIIKKEVKEKTHDLNIILQEKELLLKEVHHRVKNNLQIIISMIRLQSDNIKDKNSKVILEKLENRINAIAKTYTNLLNGDSFEVVHMKSYLGELLSDLITVLKEKSNIKITTHITTTLPFKKAVYVGLVINELITNAYKYAFKDKSGEITIKLYKQNNSHILEIQDNGIGFDISKRDNSLGLNLIFMIIEHQLNGKITLNTKIDRGTHYIIRF